MDGTTSLTFSPLALIGAFGKLTSSSTLSFSPTVTASANGALVGTSSFAFSPLALIGANGKLTATTNGYVFTPLGLIAANGKLLSTTNGFSFSPLGLIAAVGKLAGASAVTFSFNSTLAQGRKIAANTQGFGLNGIASGLALLNGSGTSTISITASAARLRNSPYRFLIYTPNELPYDQETYY